jgi:hypothetical protein
MKVLARIPLLPAVAGPDGAARAEERPAAARQATLHPAPVAEPKRWPRRAFPASSTMVLVTLAAVVWMLAVWNDSLRMARSRRPERLASQPPAAAPFDTIKP